MFEFNLNIENEKIKLPLLEDHNVELWLKREDVIHPAISGNKFRKLKYNISEAKKQNKQKIVTYGGAYSNHILAVAASGCIHKIETVGIIRGDELATNLTKVLNENKTLAMAKEFGMEFEFVSREIYKQKDSDAFKAQLKQKYGNFYNVPEGGTNPLAIKGCEEILTEEDEKFDYICVAVGTGGTIAGLINSAKSHQQILGFPALKGDFLKDEIQKLTPNSNNWSLCTDYHFGGYGKFSLALIESINKFKETTGILLDPIYTGKMIFGVLDLIQQKKIKKGSKILAIHTGGIQGIDGFNKKLKKKHFPCIKV